MSRVAERARCAVVAVALCLVGCDGGPQEATEVGAGLRVNTVLGAGAEGYARADRPRTFEFPADHGAHPAYRSEWWYLTAVLNGPDGADYGMQFTLFRQALRPEPTGAGPWHTAQAYLAHLAVTDVAGGEHLHAQRFARGHPALAGVEAAPFAAWLEDWRLGETASSPWTLDLAAQDTELGVNLTMRQTQAFVLQGDAGLSHKGPGQASYYYSLPRLEMSGTVSIRGREVPVTGLGWLDREWSTSVLGDNLSGWNWFALQLDDGSSVMAFSLTRKDGTRDPFDHGLFIGPEGRWQQTLNADDYRLEPVRFWQADDGSRWPVSWQLTFATAPTGRDDLAGQTWHIEALLDDQLMSVGLVYWEGIVGVRDAAGAPLGRGYMELTGYADD